jgi:hypothetical protein
MVVTVEPEESKVPELTVLAINGLRVEVSPVCEEAFAIADFDLVVFALVRSFSRALVFGRGASRRLLRDAKLALSSGSSGPLAGSWLVPFVGSNCCDMKQSRMSGSTAASRSQALK